MALKKIDQITLWRAKGKDGFGDISYDAPMEISVRWDSLESFIEGAENTEGQWAYFTENKIGSVIYNDLDEIQPDDKVIQKPLSQIEAGDFDRAVTIRVKRHDRNGTGRRQLFTLMAG